MLIQLWLILLFMLRILIRTDVWFPAHVEMMIPLDKMAPQVTISYLPQQLLSEAPCQGGPIIVVP